MLRRRQKLETYCETYFGVFTLSLPQSPCVYPKYRQKVVAVLQLKLSVQTVPFVSSPLCLLINLTDSKPSLFVDKTVPLTSRMSDPLTNSKPDVHVLSINCAGKLLHIKELTKIV